MSRGHRGARRRRTAGSNGGLRDGTQCHVRLEPRSIQGDTLMKAGVGPAFIIFLGSLGFLFALGPTAPFTNRGEGICEAGAVRDVLAGNWVLPRYGVGHHEEGIPTVQVPPLYDWAAALAARALGRGELAMRLPSLIATALTCAILFLWLSHALTSRAGLYAAVVFASTEMVDAAALYPRMDPMLAMFVVGALACLERAVAGPGSSRRALFWTAAILMGLGNLTKSFVGEALPAIALFGWLPWRRRDLGVPWAGLALVFAGALVLGASWYLLALAAGGGANVRWQLVGSLWHRFYDRSGVMLGPRPPWYYLPPLVFRAMPWSLFMPAALALLWVRRDNLPSAVSLAACWLIGTLLFFTLAQGKRLPYILPSFPALAALVGWLAAEADRRLDGASRALFWLAASAVAVGALGLLSVGAALSHFGLSARWLAALHPSDRNMVAAFASALRELRPPAAVWAVSLLAALTLIVLAVLRRESALASVGVALFALSNSVFWFGTLSYRLASRQSLKSFAEAIDGAVLSSATIAYHGKADCDVVFYAEHRFVELGLGRARLCSAGQPWHYFIVSQDVLQTERQRGEHLATVLASPAVDRAGPRLLVACQKALLPPRPRRPN